MKLTKKSKTCLAVSHYNHYTRMFSVFLWDRKLILIHAFLILSNSSNSPNLMEISLFRKTILFFDWNKLEDYSVPSLNTFYLLEHVGTVQRLEPRQVAFPWPRQPCSGSHETWMVPLKLTSLYPFKVRCEYASWNKAILQPGLAENNNTPNITKNDGWFCCPIIYTNTIHNAILFIGTSTMLDATQFIL